MSLISGDFMLSNVFRVISILGFLVWSSVLSAETTHPGGLVPVVNEEIYPVIAQVAGQEGVLAFQYVREGEDFKNWTRSVTYSNYRIERVGDSPASLASLLIKTLDSQTPGAKYKLMSDKEGNVVLLDYLSWPAGKKFMQLNVHRIQNGEEGAGVYLLSYAVRLKYIEEADEKSAKEINLLRASLLQQAGSFNFDGMVELLNNQHQANAG